MMETPVSQISSEDIRRMADSLGRPIVGMAVAPRTKALLDRLSLNPPGPCALLLLIDPRITEGGEVYYDQTAWNKRCEEQRKWDETR